LPLPTPFPTRRSSDLELSASVFAIRDPQGAVVRLGSDARTRRAVTPSGTVSGNVRVWVRPSRLAAQLCYRPFGASYVRSLAGNRSEEHTSELQSTDHL